MTYIAKMSDTDETPTVTNSQKKKTFFFEATMGWESVTYNCKPIQVVITSKNFIIIYEKTVW